MKRRKNTPDDTVDFVVLIVLVVLILILLANNFRNKCERREIENESFSEDNRPYLIEDEIVLTADTEQLTVQPKEAVMFPIHEMTEEEIQEQFYYDSLELLAICVEAEAGNQDLLGKRLVVDVILNRVDSEQFPNDIVSVITQPNQFSSYSDGHMDGVYEPSEETFRAVRMELETRTDCKILFFTEGKYNPYCTPAYQHGDHYFGY